VRALGTSPRGGGKIRGNLSVAPFRYFILFRNASNLSIPFSSAASEQQ